MTLVTYVPAPGYPANEQGTINAGGGQAFDVGAALQAGGGQFTVDSSVNGVLISALDRYPGLVRSGVTPGPPVATDTIGPVLAHSKGAATGDLLVRGGDGLFAPTQSLPVSQLPSSVGSGSPPSPNWLLIAWTLAEAFVLSPVGRDANDAITTASVVWPDGATGTFTTDTASATFAGSIDAYHITYVWGGGSKTITQAAVTRDAGGAVTVQPTPTVV